MHVIRLARHIFRARLPALKLRFSSLVQQTFEASSPREKLNLWGFDASGAKCDLFDPKSSEQSCFPAVCSRRLCVGWSGCATVLFKERLKTGKVVRTTSIFEAPGQLNGFIGSVEEVTVCSHLD